MSEALIMYGRAEFLRLVRECAAWPSSGRPLPVMVLFGPAGSGKTTTLRIVRNRTEKLHTAYVDVAARGFESSSEIITELVAQLSLVRKGLGTLRFPRFLLGQLALRLPTPDSSQPSKQQIRDLLSSLKGLRTPPEVRELISKAAEIGVNTAGVPVPGGTPDLLLSAVEVAFGWRRTNGEKWWSTAGRPAPDALLELHRMHHDGVDHEKQQAQDKLIQAFLADLRDSYAGRRRRAQGDVASLVLLDNVHTEAGSAFLDLLVRARNQHPDLVDPLLVVATTGRTIAEVARPDATETKPRLSYSAWQSQWTPDVTASWYLPIWLHDLSHDDAARWAREQGIYDRWTVAAVHRLTGGHRLGVAELLATGPAGTDGRPSRSGADQARIRRLGVPRGGGRSLADLLLDQLLADIPEERRDEVITCSASRNLTATEIQAALGNTTIHAADDLRVLLDERLWLDTGRSTPMHPFLSRLLHLHLQARPDDHPDSWTAVHTRLRAHCDDSGDIVGALHHGLALDEVREVAHQLDQILDREDDGDVDWLATLKEVTAAPNRLAKTGDIAPREVVSWTADLDRRAGTVALLVAGLWIQSDPLTASQPTLSRTTAHQFIELASLVPRLSDALFAMAEKCRREADTYDA
ncbi:ATP-binding protein [Solwaraspora sp. WMMD406]|uniref:ATP-binding protein n=1 Tax=Solwaraspora sp. WMMD406 TaxID=3016095 RepID=UPI00241729C1|nr:ATP-binding protein [Solwaraspora sp. WMMD406]MDG4765426.1 ATP-binding protein [Solwaraspora sp. WMMD406]